MREYFLIDEGYHAPADPHGQEIDDWMQAWILSFLDACSGMSDIALACRCPNWKTCPRS